MPTKKRKVPTDDAQFDQFWSEYPRCVDKPGTKRAFARALTVASFDAIMAGLRAYPFNRELHLQPHSCTWLNQSRWEGYVTHKPPTVAVRESRTSWRDRFEHIEIPFNSFPESRTAALNEGGPVIDGRLALDE